MVTEGNAVWSRWRPLELGFALAALSYVSQHLFRNIAAQLQNTPRQRKEGGPGEMKKLEKFVVGLERRGRNGII